MCRSAWLLVVCSALYCLNRYEVCAKAIEKRQTQAQAQIETNINAGGLLNLASNLHNLAGNVLNKIQQSVQNGGQFQWEAQFGLNGQKQDYGTPQRYPYEPPGRPPFGPPPQHNGFRPPGQQQFGQAGYGRHPPPPPPPPHSYSPQYGYPGHFGPPRPPGRPDFGQPGFGPPGGKPPHGPPPEFESYPPPPPPSPSQYPFDEPNNQSQPDVQSPNEQNEKPGNDEGLRDDKDTKAISGYIDGSFPIILLDEENEIRK